jgi:hypothetical protein
MHAPCVFIGTRAYRIDQLIGYTVQDPKKQPDPDHAVDSVFSNLKKSIGNVGSGVHLLVFRSQVICLGFYCQDNCYAICNFRDCRTQKITPARNLAASKDFSSSCS